VSGGSVVQCVDVGIIPTHNAGQVGSNPLQTLKGEKNEDK